MVHPRKFHIQYTAIYTSVKIDNFKVFLFFLLTTCIMGAHLDSPNLCSGANKKINVYP